MKYISQHSDRLSQAFKRIEELEKENIRLRKEIVVLRAAKPPRSTNSISSPSPKGNPHYAQPTRSSRNKDKLELQGPESIEDEKPRFVIIDEDTYVYKHGVPILTGEDKRPWGLKPRFMQLTSSSYKREIAKLHERLERRKQATLQPSWHSPAPTPKAYGNGWGSPDKEVEVPSEEPLGSSIPLPSAALTPTPPEEEVENEPEDNLAERSRLDESLPWNIGIRTDSKTSLDYLRRAAEIVQKSIFDARENGGLGRSRGWDDSDGPHLVLLGRNELMSWLGEYPEANLARNGYSAWMVHHRLLDVVPLRNAISHPSGRELRDPFLVDAHLKSAQAVCVVLGDEKGTLEIREIRDALRNDTDNAWQCVKDLYFLSLQPYPGAFDVQYHHVTLFKWILDMGDRLYKHEREDYEEVLAVARAWDSQRG